MKKLGSQIVKVTGNIDIDIIDVKSKRVLETRHFTNILTNNGLKLHRVWSAGIPPLSDPNFNVDTRITHIAVGDGNTTPGVTQTTLDNELLRKQIYNPPDANCGIELEATRTKFFMLIDETELNGETLREIALFSESFTPFMVSRFLCGNLSKNDSIQFLIKYYYTYSS